MGIPLLNQKKQSRFVVSIGDEGAVIVLVHGRRMIRRIFATSPAAPEFRELLNSHPSAGVSILVDVVDQAFIRHTMPPVSMLNISKLVNRKLEKDFDENDISAAMPLGRDKGGKKEWNFLFVAVRNIPPFSDWIDAILETQNPFEGIFLLPVESMKYLRDIRKPFEKEHGKSASGWHILVSHNRVGGFRQIVFHNGHILFTRIAQPIGGQTPDVVAGNIEQETLNTIEYIRRLGYQDQDGLDIHIIAAGEVKEEMRNSVMPCNSLAIHTPFEIAQYLDLPNAAEDKDRFGDVVFATYFATNHRPVLRLQTDRTQKVYTLQQTSQYIKIGGAIAALLLVILASWGVYDILKLQEDIDGKQREKDSAERRLRKIMDFSDEFSGDSKDIQKITTLDSQLSKHSRTPLDFLSSYAEIRGFSIFARNLSFSLNSEQGEEHARLNVEMNLELVNKNGDRPEQLLEQLDIFANDMRKRFSNYQVSFYDLPGQNEISIDLESGNFANFNRIPFRVSISGPEEKADDSRKRRRR